MNKMSFITVSLLAALAGCLPTEEMSTKKVHEKPIDIYTFTKEYEQRDKTPLVLAPQQQETLNKVIESYNIFLNEKAHRNFPSINSFAKKNNWSISISDGGYEYYYYTAQLSDGSNVSILFEHFNFGDDTHEVHVYKLTEAQCDYLTNYFKYNTKIKEHVERYSYGPGSISSNGASCKDFSDEKKYSISVSLSHDGKIKAKEYFRFAKQLPALLNKDYERVIKDSAAKLYFTDKPVSYKTFYDGVDYVINPNNGHVTVGALDIKECKRLTYDLPAGIEHSINEGKKCSDGLNSIEFYPKHP